MRSSVILLATAFATAFAIPSPDHGGDNSGGDLPDNHDTGITSFPFTTHFTDSSGSVTTVIFTTDFENGGDNGDHGHGGGPVTVFTQGGTTVTSTLSHGGDDNGASNCEGGDGDHGHHGDSTSGHEGQCSAAGTQTGSGSAATTDAGEASTTAGATAGSVSTTLSKATSTGLNASPFAITGSNVAAMAAVEKGVLGLVVAAMVGVVAL